MNWVVRLSDTVKFILLFLMICFAYKPKWKGPVTVLLILGMILLGQGGVLLEEWIDQNHFFLYILNFIIWGICFSAVAVKGKLIEKTVAVALYCSSLFCIEDIVRYGEICIVGTAANRYWRLVSLVFLLLVAVFLRRNAIRTERDVPKKYYIGILGIVFISLGVYYVIRNISNASRGFYVDGTEAAKQRAIASFLMLISVYATYWLFSNFTGLYEQNISKAAVQNRTAAEESMVRESVRLNSEILAQRHEMNHHLALLDALLKNGETEKAQSLLAQLTAQEPAGNDPAHSGNVIADAILRQFAARAAEQGIEFHMEVSLGQVLPLTDTELSSLLSNLLNNAMEASAQVSDPMINVKIYPTRWYLCFYVCNRANVTIVKQNPDLQTTKKDPEAHGFRLSVIREIAERHDGRASFTLEEDGLFHSRVMILMNNK